MVALSVHILESCIAHYVWCDCVFIAYRIAEWTIEVMKAARTSIFEPEVSYFHSSTCNHIPNLECIGCLW